MRDRSCGDGASIWTCATTGATVFGGADVASMDRAERSVNVPSISLRREAGGQDSAGRLGNAASETLPWSFFSFFSIVLGTVLHVLSYGSFSPVLVAGMFYGMGLVILFSTPLGGVPEQRMFSQVFGNCLVMAGVAAIYANQFGDPGQLYSDPAGFYEMAIGEAKGLTLEQLQAINEGSLAIVIWSAVYDIFETMGFEKERYVGITVNVTAVALSGVIGIKIVRNLFGDDYYRFRRLTLLVSTCGLFWLFAGIHLRDSLVLLCVSTIIWTWVRLISKPDVHWRLVHVVLASLFGAAFFVYFRKEFVFLPLALLVAGMTAIAVGDLRSNRVTLYALGAIAGTISVTVGVFFASEVVQLLESGRADYLDEGGRSARCQIAGHGIDSKSAPSCPVAIGDNVSLHLPDSSLVRIPVGGGLRSLQITECFVFIFLVAFACCVCVEYGHTKVNSVFRIAVPSIQCAWFFVGRCWY
jgi:hypothetical protein